MLLTRFWCFLFWLWVNHFCLFCVHWMLFYYLVILGQISTACSEPLYRKLEFCFTSFWFYHHRLWWSSWHAMLALFLLYLFLVWIFSLRDLFQVTATDASCVLYIICSQFITFKALFCLLHLLYCIVGIIFCRFGFALFVICFWLNLIVQFTSEFSLSFFHLCKVSTEDSDHVIL